VTVDPIDITSRPPSLAELRLGLEQLGRQRLFNTSGQSYRTIGSTVIRAMSDEQALAALAADGRLVKRPYLITPSGRVITGFRPEEWEALLAA
jgi:arsenate reductase